MHTSSVTLTLLLATFSTILNALPPTLVRRAVTAENPTGVNLKYEVAWHNPTTGKFGASVTFAESAPAATPTVFSIKFYFGAQTSTISDYWGDWKVVHYQSGAFHMQPGMPPAGATNNSRTYQFNGAYQVVAGSNSTFAQPAAMSLLHGANYEDRETAFQRDDISAPAVPANLPTAPIGAFVRDTAKAPSAADKGPATGASAATSKTDDGSAVNSNLPIIIGAIGAIVVIGAAIAVFAAVRRKKSPEPAGGLAPMSVARKGSHGQVGREAVLPHVEQTTEMNVVASDAPHYAGMPNENNYYDEGGYAVTEQGADDQMAFVEQYAPQPGYHYAEVDEVEGDDYNLHQHMMTAAQISKETNPSAGYYQAGEYEQPNANGDYFLAQEVMDRSETSQAVAIDHAYVTQAIGYHQAQIEQRIQQDSMDSPSPMLTLTHADGGEQLYLQEEDYVAYEADPYTAQPVGRKDSGAKRAPGKNYI